MSRAYFVLFLIALSLPTTLTAAPTGNGKPTFRDCKVLGHYGRIVMVTYCPAATPPSEMASFVLATKDIWIAKYGFVQYRIFSTKDGAPMSAAESMDKPDAWFEKYEIGIALYNKATGRKEFSCKKNPKGKLVDCTTLLR